MPVARVSCSINQVMFNPTSVTLMFSPACFYLLLLPFFCPQAVTFNMKHLLVSSLSPKRQQGSLTTTSASMCCHLPTEFQPNIEQVMNLEQVMSLEHTAAAPRNPVTGKTFFLVQIFWHICVWDRCQSEWMKPKAAVVRQSNQGADFTCK